MSEDGERLEMFAYRGYDASSPFIRHFLHEGSKPACDAARRDGRRLIVEDVETFPELLGTADREVALRSGIRATQSTPMVTRGGTLVGVLSNQFRTPHRPAEAQLRLIDLLAWHTAEVVEHQRAQTALRTSEQKYRSLFDSMGQGYCELELVRDEAGRATDQLYLELNPAFERLFGVPVSAAKGRLASEVFPQLEASWTDAFDRVARTGTPERIEQLVATLGRWFEVFAYPEAGDRVVVLYEDITERKQAEQALSSSEQRFRALTTAGAYVMYRMSADWRLMYELSGPALQPSGAEPIANWPDVYLLAEDRPIIFAAIDEAIRTRSLFELEHRVRRADGTIGWVISRAVPILSADGEVVEWFGAGSDITLRKQAEAALRASEEKYRADLQREVRERTAELQQSRDLLRATMDSSMDMIQVFEAIRNERGEIVDFRWVLNNHTSENKYGAVRGESLLQRNPGVIAEGIFDAFRKVVETGEPIVAERHYQHEQFNGWFFQSAVKLGDGVATTTKEITAWKEAQEEVLRLRDEVAQARLREHEEKYRTFFESIDEGFCTIELIDDASGRPVDYRFLEVNRAFAQHTGLQNVVGQPGSVVAPGTEPAWLEIYDAVSRTGEPARFENYHQATGRWYLVYASRVGSPERRQVATVFNDITRRRRAEEALRESEERYRLMFETMDEGYLLADVIFDEAGKAIDIEYLQANPAAIRMVGSDLTGRRLREVAGYEEYWYEIWGRVARTGKPEHLEQYAAHDGIWYDFNVFKIERNNPESRRVAVLFRDVTRRRLAEDALRESEEQFRRAVEDAPIPVIMYAEDGQVLQISRSWTELTGFRPEDVPTFEAWLNHAYGAGAEAVHTHMHQLFTGTKRSVDMEIPIRTRRGDQRHWSFSASSPGTLRDGRRFIVGMAVDITDRKRAEDRQQLLIGELNHRVKNTLATVQSIAGQTLRSTPDPGEFVLRFRERIQALSGAHNLLTRMTWQGADIADIVREQMMLGENGSHVSASGPPAFLDAQASLALALVLHELGTNARKHGALSVPEGRLTIVWGVDGDPGSPRLQLDWTERGGPPVRPPERNGFGTTLVRQSLRGVGGRTEIRFEPEGLLCRIDLPLGRGPGQGLSRKDDAGW